MSELQLLYLILVVLYGWECACWTRRGVVAFRTWFGRSWRAVQAGAVLGNQRGGFVFAHPLPPLGTVLTGNLFPLSLSPSVLLAYVAPSSNAGWRFSLTGKCLGWDAIRSIEARGKKLCVNGGVLAVVSSVTFAASLAAHLRRIQKLPPAKREEFIERTLRGTLDIAAIKSRWEDFHKQTARLRWLANLLFGYVFCLAPILIWTLGLKVTWPGLVAGLLALTITSAVLFRRAHKAFYPSAEEERFTQFLLVMLAPVTTMRTCDLLSRPLLESFHPLALAKVFCSDQTFREFARIVLVDIRYPAPAAGPEQSPEARAAEQYARALWQRVAEDFLRKSGIKPDDLLHPPQAADASCRSYCPRCGAQFTTTGGVCEDCGGVALVPFAGKNEEGN